MLLSEEQINAWIAQEELYELEDECCIRGIV